SHVLEQVSCSAVAIGLPANDVPLDKGGEGARAYAEAVITYLACAVDRIADRHSTLTRWDPNPSGYAPKIANTFARQALPMVWDYTEGNPFSDSSGNFADAVDWVCKVLDRLPASSSGNSGQVDATTGLYDVTQPIILTVPHSYDTIGYADFSDFFDVWLRRSLGKVYSDLFSTLLVPKAQELVATAYRFGGDAQKAKAFFEEGLGKAFAHMREIQHPNYPMTVFYAFKQ